MVCFVVVDVGVVMIDLCLMIVGCLVVECIELEV